MATSQSTMDFLLDQLSGCGPVTARKMFGEYCLYFAGKPIGLLCDNQLFLKPTTAARALMHEPLDGIPYPKARPHLLVSADLWDDRQSLCQYVRATYDALRDVPPSKPKKPRKPAVQRAPGGAPALADLVNLGPKSQQMLLAAGIRTVAQLRKLGSVATYVRVKKSGLPASLNLLWALEGALTGLPWQVVAREHRTSLLLALEHLQEMDTPSQHER
ncbi:MAG: TfoX/Sxy family DNA transformation protein [Rhodoferax sp.]|nr:TfoX/Sxy family DNA transformation protein [Rhodoferax sp.]